MTSPFPYKILVLAPFSPVPQSSFTPVFTDVDLYSLDQALALLGPALYLPETGTTFSPEKISDFKPRNLEKQLPMEKGPAGIASAMQTEGKSAVDDILSMVADSVEKPPLESGTGRFELGQIFANPEFAAMESAWLGLRTLLKQGQITGTDRIRVTICPVSEAGLDIVLNTIREMSPSQSPNLILMGLGFDNTHPSLLVLETLLEFAHAMMVPTALELTPGFFNLDSFTQMNQIPYLKHFLEDSAHAKFRKLASRDGAEWILPLCNCFAARPAHEFERSPLYISPVWALGSLVAESLAETGWPMGFTRCRMEDLPMGTSSEQGASSVDGLFSEDRILQFIQVGITPLAGIKNRDSACMPRTACLNGDAPGFGMFFNRIIDALLTRKETLKEEHIPENEIADSIRELFIFSGHGGPEELTVMQKDAMDSQGIYDISFIPPATVMPGREKIQFSFMWE